SGPWRSPASTPPREVGPWRPGAQDQHLPSPGDGPWRPGQPAAAAGPWRPGVQDPRSPVRQERSPRVNAATIIAAIGGAVMLAGIAFLLVVAIQAGLFPPIARVIAAAVLAVILVVLGIRLQSRHEASEGSRHETAEDGSV